MYNKEYIDEETKTEQIKAYKKAYTETIVNIYKLPILINACNEAVEEEWITDDRKKTLQNALKSHQDNLKANNESLMQLEQIIPLIETI